MQELNKINANSNLNLYKKYKMFSYDFLFYYAIQIMFFTITKGFSMSQVMYITGAYLFFTFLWQFIGNYIVEKLDMKKSIVLGNILMSINIIVYIVSNNFIYMILSCAIGALGTTLKSLSEGSLLYASLKSLDRRKDFSKVEGKSNSKYYYYDAISSVLSGFLFLINNYIPVILCLVNLIISLYLSLKFKEIKSTEKVDNSGIVKTLKEYKNLLTINRTKAIFLFSFAFMGIITASGLLYKAVLIDLKIQTQYITIIICTFTLLVGLGAKFLFSIEKITKNKTLAIFSILFTLSMLIIGLVGLSNNLRLLSLVIIMLALAVMGIIQGAYRIAMKKYVFSFTNSGVRTKITSIYYMSENLGSAFTSFFIGFMLNYTKSSITYILFSIISFGSLFFIIKYMKTRIGLNPEQYKPKEIYYKKLS